MLKSTDFSKPQKNHDSISKDIEYNVEFGMAIVEGMEVDFFRYNKEYVLITEDNNIDVKYNLIKILKFNAEETAHILRIMIDEGWTIERFDYALKRCLKSHKYTLESMSPANILAIGDVANFYTYSQMLEYNHKKQIAGNLGFHAIYIDNNKKPYWCNCNDEKCWSAK